MENVINEIKNILQNEMYYKLIIIDSKIYQDYSREDVENKIEQLNLAPVYLDYAKCIRVIELCNELIERQSLKLDGDESKLPLIVLNSISSDFPYTKELSLVDNEIEIIKKGITKYHLPISEYHKLKYIILTKEDASYFKNDDIYLSCDDLLSFNFMTFEKVSPYGIFSNIKGKEITLANIIPTYMEIMKKKNPFSLIKKDEQTYILKSKKYEFKILMILKDNELMNDDIDISNFELIIEVKEYKAAEESVLRNEIVDVFYGKNKIKIGDFFTKKQH